MMFMPLWIFLAVLYYVVAASTFLFGFILFALPIFRRGSLAKSCLGIAIMALGLSIAFGERHESVESKAECVMKLPPGVQVVNAELGDWAGEGTVVFKSPANQPAQVWFEKVWKMNKSGKPNAVVENEPPPKLMRTEWVDEDRRTLEYNPKTQLYHYVVWLGL